MTKNDDMPKEGDLQVWWCPQCPMKSFKVDVENIDEAMLLLNTLAYYDLFQFENKVKGDYANAGGLNVYEGEEWITWYDEEEGEEIDYYLHKKYPGGKREIKK